jgi:hypothetical protein
LLGLHIPSETDANRAEEVQNAQGIVIDQPRYHIDIFWSDEGEGYVANVPDLRYSSAFGES